MTDKYILFDERYMTDPDRALVQSVEESLHEAKAQVEDFGYPCVIVGPGVEDGLYWVPVAMREQPELRDVHGKVVPPLDVQP
jgi:hypothetical protein